MRTQLDWLAFRTKDSPCTAAEALEGLYGPLGDSLRLNQRPRGWMGYERSYDVVVAGVPMGLAASGGHAQKDWTYVSLTGEGLEWASYFGGVDRLPSLAADLTLFEVRRADLALTVADGSITHESVMAAYEAGGFSLGRRPPKLSQILPAEPTDGRTIYVGDRKGSKYLRAYEKGYQLIQSGKLPRGCTHVNDAPISQMYRLEVEYKPVDAPLPLDLIERRDQYFAGAYPYLQQVMGIDPEPWFMKPPERAAMTLESTLANIRHQYGKALFTALMVHGGSITDVWAKIVGDEHSQALVDAGVLLPELSQLGS